MAISYTVTINGRSVNYTAGLNSGAKGEPGDTGMAGPNEVTTATATDITGLLKGNGSTVEAAVAGTDYAEGSHTHDAADLVSGTIDEARFPDVITVDGVTLSDGSAVELPDGTLALDASNPPKLMIHDGATTGGVPAEGWIMRGAVSLLDSDGIANDTPLQISRLVLPVDFIANTSGTAIASLTGKVSIFATNTGYVPAINPYIAIYFENSTAGVAAGYKIEVPFTASSTEIVLLDINQVFTLSKSTSITLTPSTSRNTVRNCGSSFTLDTFRAFSSYGSSFQRSGNTTVPCPVICSLVIPQDTDSGSLRVNASCDLRLEFTQP